MKVRLGVFFGGRSVENEVSVITAIQAINSFDRAKYDIVPVYIGRDNTFYTGEYIGKIEEYRDINALLKKSARVIPVGRDKRCELVKYPYKRLTNPVADYFDVAFPIVHGTNVEDGALQGFFRTLDVPFVGCDVLASAAGMDKYVMKLIFKDAGLPVLDCVKFGFKRYAKQKDAVIGEAEKVLRYPVIVKPVDLGSSVGIKLARDRNELEEAADYAFTFAQEVIVENAVLNLREINCSVLGDYEEAKASECEEPVSGGGFLSYDDKYAQGAKGSQKGMGGSKRLLPAPVPDEMRERIRDIAVRAFKAIGCCGVARIDFLLDGVSGELHINEINTIPGSLAFYLWQASGLSYTHLLDELVSLALKREREKEALSYTIETGILAGFTGGLKGAKQR